MPQRLDIIASYYSASDFVEVDFAVFEDGDIEPIDTTEMKTASVALLYGRSETLAQVSGMTSRNAGSDLRYTVVFNRPVTNRSLQVRVTVVGAGQYDGSTWTAIQPVSTIVEPAKDDLGDNKQAIMSSKT